MTDIELKRVAKKLKIPHFRGVFMRDQLINMKPEENECAIINLDSSKGSGTHWVAYSKRGSRTLYYNSFGDVAPPSELTRYLGGSSLIEYNFSAEQAYGTVICGHLCLSFLIKAARHWDPTSQ